MCAHDIQQTVITICMMCIAATAGIYMSIESLGRRAIPALVRMGTRGGLRGINLIHGIKLRIPPHGPPVHVYPTEHVHQHVSHVSHVVAEPEPEASYTHVSHASYAEPHPEPYYEPHHHSYHHSHHLPHAHYSHYGHHDFHHGHHSVHPLAQPGLGPVIGHDIGLGGGGFLDHGLF